MLRICALALLACLAASSASPASTHAQLARAPEAGWQTAGPTTICYAGGQTPASLRAVRRVLEDRAAGKRATATFVVTYDSDFPTQARTAFEEAARIWGLYLDSSQTIHVTANWEALASGVLGSAGATTLTANYLGAPFRDTWYVIALAEAIAGDNLNGAGQELTATFNGNRSNWYYGLDGNPGPGEYDFVSVALHELGHGLGFSSTFTVDDGVGEAECNGVDGIGCWGQGALSYPLSYDLFVEDILGQSLLDTGVYPDTSQVLGDTLQSGRIRFDGPAATNAGGMVPIELYAPTTYQRGSSFSHLDEAAFPAGSEDALMTPLIASGEAFGGPGPVTCGVMSDLGWPLGDACLTELPVVWAHLEARRSGGALLLVWTTAAEQDNAGYGVEHRLDEGPFAELAFVPGAGSTGQAQTYTYRLEDPLPGRHAFRLRQVDRDGRVRYSREVVVSEPAGGTHRLAVYPNPIRDHATVRLALGRAQVVSVSVYDGLGRRVAHLHDGPVEAEHPLVLDLDASPFPAGTYWVRVEGEGLAAASPLVRVR